MPNQQNTILENQPSDSQAALRTPHPVGAPTSFTRIVVPSVHFMSANDALERDPVKFLLEWQKTATG
jgi:hypothetical protein